MVDRRLPFGFGPPPELMAAIPPLHGPQSEAPQYPQQWPSQPHRHLDLSQPRAGRKGFEDAMGVMLPELAPFALGPLGRVAAKAPRAIAGAGAMLFAPSKAGGQPSEDVKKLQIRMRDAGYYDGNIDGQMGQKTKAAKAAFDAAELERQRLQAQQDASAAQKADADQKRQAEEQRAQERAAGEERMRGIEENISPFSRAIRDYSEPVGYAGGMLAGYLTRRGAVGGSNYLSARQAARSDAMLDGTRGVPQRVGAVNQFWTEGQRPGLAGARRAPFEVTSQAPRGYRANPAGHPPASELYQPPRSVMGNTGTDLGVATGFGLESGLSSYMGSKAHTELDAAQRATSADPSELNIQRLQAAKDNVAFWDGMAAFGRTGALTHLGLGAKMTRTPTRPNVARAEAMQMQLGQKLAPPTAPLGVPAAPRKRIPKGQPGGGRFTD